MKTYARILPTGIVIGVYVPTEFDGVLKPVEELFTPEFVSELTDVTGCDPLPVVGLLGTEGNGGWSFAEPVAPQPTDEELRAAAIAKRDVLLHAANEATVGMADAYIAELLEPEDAIMFKAYAAYKYALNKITSQAEFPLSITWPVLPS